LNHPRLQFDTFEQALNIFQNLSAQMLVTNQLTCLRLSRILLHDFNILCSSHPTMPVSEAENIVTSNESSRQTQSISRHINNNNQFARPLARQAVHASSVAP
jgi:hypothetical protein